MNAQILGGPRDGEVWPVIGPTLVMPKPVTRLHALNDRSVLEPIPRDYYLLRRDDDAKYFYVLQGR